jgi:hypothetical protein
MFWMHGGSGLTQVLCSKSARSTPWPASVSVIYGQPRHQKALTMYTEPFIVPHTLHALAGTR